MEYLPPSWWSSKEPSVFPAEAVAEVGFGRARNEFFAQVLELIDPSSKRL
jgi:hypothetical protein